MISLGKYDFYTSELLLSAFAASECFGQELCASTLTQGAGELEEPRLWARARPPNACQHRLLKGNTIPVNFGGKNKEKRRGSPRKVQRCSFPCNSISQRGQQSLRRDQRHTPRGVTRPRAAPVQRRCANTRAQEGAESPRLLCPSFGLSASSAANFVLLQLP